MEYPDLKATSLRQIWTTSLQASSRKNEVDAKSLNLLADINLNGRQIKNVLKTAGLLAAKEEQPDAV
jgi:ATP-dependent 26S proteasome regulatory subunit